MAILRSLITIILLSNQIAFAQMKPHWQFKSELMSNLISPKDTIYIFDRHYLEKYTEKQTLIKELEYSTKSGDKSSVFIQSGAFEPLKHKLNLDENLIDEKKAYGIFGTTSKGNKILKNKMEPKIADNSYQCIFKSL